jgi:hypothetical protein
LPSSPERLPIRDTPDVITRPRLGPIALGADESEETAMDQAQRPCGRGTFTRLYAPFLDFGSRSTCRCVPDITFTANWEETAMDAYIELGQGRPGGAPRLTRSDA